MINAWIWLDGGESIALGSPHQTTPVGRLVDCSWEIKVTWASRIGMIEIFVDGLWEFLPARGLTWVKPGGTYQLNCQVMCEPLREVSARPGVRPFATYAVQIRPGP